MRTWKVVVVSTGWVELTLYQEGVNLHGLFVSSVEAANQIGRIWAVHDPSDC